MTTKQNHLRLTFLLYNTEHKILMFSLTMMKYHQRVITDSTAPNHLDFFWLLREQTELEDPEQELLLCQLYVSLLFQLRSHTKRAFLFVSTKQSTANTSYCTSDHSNAFLCATLWVRRSTHAVIISSGTDGRDGKNSHVYVLKVFVSFENSQ